MESLPFELASSIAQSMNLREAKSMHLALTSGTSSPRGGLKAADSPWASALSERIDPSIYLRGLTRDPEGLLKLMCEYSCVIGGQCVFPFFFPNITLSKGPWRIICPRTKWKSFAKESTALGMVWRVSEHSMTCSHSDYLPMNVKVHIGFSPNYRGKHTRVELVDLYSDTPLHAIMSAATTATQCFISDSVARHLYYAEVERNTATVWLSNIARYVPRSQHGTLQRSPCDTCKTVYGMRVSFGWFLFMRYKACIYDKDVDAIEPLMRATARETGMTTRELAATVVAECKCEHNDGTSILREYRRSGLKLTLGRHVLSTRMTADSPGTYSHQFRPTESGTVQSVLSIAWLETPDRTLIEND